MKITARLAAVVLGLLLASVEFPFVRLAAQNDQSQSDRRETPRRRSNSQRSNGLYIVRMSDLPVATYGGGVPGLANTRPARGGKIDPDNPDVNRYRSYLDSQHDRAVRAVGGRKVYDYRYTINGFAAELSEVQASLLATAPGVLTVTKDVIQFADTSSTPAFLGLDDRGGLWDQLGGVGRAGEDIVIGVIDSGVWPESLSFADRTKPRRHDFDGDRRGKDGEDDDEEWSDSGKLVYDKLKGWHGQCVAGEAFPVSKCNRKLIGARRFNAAWGGDEGIKEQLPWEFASPRDYNGHGTHTASTAGGNHGVRTTGDARLFGRTSGMAPRARIAMYKALWSLQDGSEASGFTSDLVAAIDQAVADGVDVINYSISGTQTSFLEPAQVSFLFAADAGVFVAASAGNDGVSGSVAHPGPWVTTVAAGTHNRTGEGSARLGTMTFNGGSLARPVGPAPLIDSVAAGLPGADPTALALCFTAGDNDGMPVLDPAKVAGKIVVCDRGVNARTAKSVAVKDAGGVGMILVNTAPNTVNADLHFVPTVHLADTDRALVKAYAATVGATATINQSTLVFDTPAPFTAAFSSRGPLQAGGGDLLKPDLIAPGQDIVASVAPPGNHGRSFDVYSGTSMSSPHVAGLAALLRNLHPDWSPMMIKSALMTTGTDVIDGGVPAPNTNPVLIFRQGAGHVNPNAAAHPGLVYDAGFNDWLAFLCGATTGVNPAACSDLAAQGYSLDPSDLNVPSISIGALAGSQTIARTVTNVGRRKSTYTATLQGLTGITTTIAPTSLKLGPGASGTFTVTFTQNSAPLNAFSGGQLYWSDGDHTARSPVTVRPVALAAPVQVSSAGGPISYNVTFGYSGTFAAAPRGLIPATQINQAVVDDPGDSFSPGGPGVTAIPVMIAAGTTYARFSLFDANVTPASDLDLYVYRGTTLVGASGSGTSNEEVNLVNPAAGAYTVYVHGFNVPGTANFTLFSWLLGSASAGNMNVSAPAAAVLSGTGTINLTFSGLTAGTKYLGSVAYSGVAGLPNPTIVRVDP
jgi:subtilisin family serine protease